MYGSGQKKYIPLGVNCLKSLRIAKIKLPEYTLFQEKNGILEEILWNISE